jgi:hypothetical protein
MAIHLAARAVLSPVLQCPEKKKKKKTQLSTYVSGSDKEHHWLGVKDCWDFRGVFRH